MKKINATSRDLKAINLIGKRLRWVREHLALTQKKVSEDLGLFQSSYSDKENGKRCKLLEEYLLIADYFDDAWKKKWTKGSFPCFENEEIREIKVQWLLFGVW